ncbi:hypothetical protein BX666DRAFT_1987888 [Dichotomocladium elegans]|nr:hypothetical protein BX666DRAFT_1987888 [Dichotomocladium elegans]
MFSGQQQQQQQQQRGGVNGNGFHHGFTNGTSSSRGDGPPLPPPTPTTSGIGGGGSGGGSSSLQRQQFLQPFEQLFETIETTRTLKSTLDEQIRRSSTLMQTLQASSTTIEGLVRNQIKEAQKELMVELDGALESILGRIEKLEAVVGHEYDREEPPPGSSDPLVVEVTSSSSNKSIPNTAMTNGSNSSVLRSPPTIVRSQNDIGPNEYHELLNALRERLDRLERQFDH